MSGSTRHPTNNSSDQHFLTNDGQQLYYQSHGHQSNRILILIHGFSGSSEYFVRNFAALSQEHWVIALDLRGHGKSTKATHGYHVARLAADLSGLLDHLRAMQPEAAFVGVGCSLGAAVLWSYTELFTSARFCGMVFVDQAPLQDYLPDGSWNYKQGNYGCHDAASLAMAQATLTLQPDTFYRGLVEGCLAYRHAPTKEEEASYNEEMQAADEAFFVAISQKGDSKWFAKLLANHTSLDHRDAIAHAVRCPCVVMGARRSGSFPLLGLRETERLVNSKRSGTAKWIVAESGHWMFYEDAAWWNRCILEQCATFFSQVQEMG